MTQFKDLEIGEQFVFKYEIEWNNYQAEQIGKFSPSIPYVPIFIKISEEKYRFFDILVDNRKSKGYKPMSIIGFPHRNAYVCKAVKAQDSDWKVTG